ncbi:UrcA family protein [Altererythrobacter arenosus]|uniref:UrcA family protein n=1 Tax=Altererythrobacter arenosus TaxID=3032592 RepID=A0ABY8FZ16_9SPHN|nr:UrcA family protein [Altererythrobacter sp. CAU 1644]WFL78631.1 UrcA family protein [Altererythrobacter sp. CAU 1644]
MFKTTLVSVALGTAMLASPAMAGGQKPAAQIEFKDLNLSTAEGQKALDGRIEAVARQICKVDEQVTGSRMVPRDRMACVKAAKKSAKQQVAALIERDKLGG